ncbi:MAG: C39 family peptidase [Lachnospiraceae bacterium]|nr:C39 family peptidase [Lachnospiraceae bacterium]
MNQRNNSNIHTRGQHGQCKDKTNKQEMHRSNRSQEMYRPNQRSEKHRQGKRNRKRRRRFSMLPAVFLFVLILAAATIFKTPQNTGNLSKFKSIYNGSSGSEAAASKAVAAFAEDNGLELSDYPESIVALLERNPETLDFVLSYPLEYGKKHKISLSEYKNSESVPLFMQWDKRWGYIDYGNDVAALTGCGPICLSMAGYYLTGDEKTFRPDNVIRFALENGYCASGSGSYWTLISEGGKRLGLDVTEIPLNQERIIKNLKVGNPIICIMGPGAFTSSGHFIILAGTEDGKFRINDPNSHENSERLWDYEEFANQIRNLWVIRK